MILIDLNMLNFNATTKIHWVELRMLEIKCLNSNWWIIKPQKTLPWVCKILSQYSSVFTDSQLIFVFLFLFLW